MNKNLLKLNKSSMTEDEQNEINAQVITQDLNSSGYDLNKQLALIFNILNENMGLLKDTEHKEELKKFLEDRATIKADTK